MHKLGCAKFDMTREFVTSLTRFFWVFIKYDFVLIKFVLISITYLINELYSCQAVNSYNTNLTRIDIFNYYLN